jgi:tetratricopeptide (TPR) repeat protein
MSLIPMVVGVWYVLVPPLYADEGNSSEDKVDLSDTVTGVKGRAPSVQIGDVNSKRGELLYDGEKKRQYPERIYDGAKWLKSTPEFVWTCWRVMDALYKRDKLGIHGILDEARQKFPDSGIAPTGKALLWQIFMLENFDFKYEKQYKFSFQAAKQELELASMTPGNDAWEAFLMGALLGVDGIHEMRKEKWLSALNRGYEGIQKIEEAKQLAPDFVDARLGDGLWLYWRSLLAMNIPAIPDFADERVKGIEMMQLAEREGVFLRPAASHALTYTWIEESKLGIAESTALRLAKRYPDNIINLQVLGRVQHYRRKYTASEGSFKRVLEVDEKNERAHYYLARLYLRWKKYDLAKTHIEKYLTYDLSKSHKGYAYFIQGKVYSRLEMWGAAEKSFRTSYKEIKLSSAKALAERAAEKAKSQ